MEKETEIKLTQKELELIQNFLLAKKIYIPYDLRNGEKWGHKFWEPYMGVLLDKVTSKLKNSDD